MICAFLCVNMPGTIWVKHFNNYVFHKVRKSHRDNENQAIFDTCTLYKASKLVNHSNSGYFTVINLKYCQNCQDYGKMGIF